MITKRQFGRTKDGRIVTAYTIHDGERFLTALDLGGIVQQLVVPDKDGNLVDVVLGYNDVASYEDNDGYLGALIGRFGNRIAGGKLAIDGKTYSLFCNDKGNHLHGGKSGFNAKIWDTKIDGDKLKFHLHSPDMEENYPGNLDVEICYSFENGEWKIEYTAVSDKKTAINLTNHAYFNLSGENEESVLDHVLYLESNEITPTDAAMIPSGKFRAVAGTPFDFNTPKAIGRDIDSDDIDLVQGKGYDHCYLLKGGCGTTKMYAEAVSPKTGIVMQCATDMPAVQLYTGNFLDQDGKTGYYAPRAGFCLETQAIPNNVNVPAYAEKGSSIYDAGVKYHFTACYRFGVKPSK